MVGDRVVDFNRAERLRFARIDDDTARWLRAFWPTAEKHLPAILEGFYAQLATVPKLSGMVGRLQNQLKQAQTRHWARLFEGTFDERYMESTHRVGLAHKRIGLEPRWYVAAYQILLNDLIAAAFRSNFLTPWRIRPIIKALNQALMLDMELAISSYVEEMMGDINTCVDTVGLSLSKMAGGSLNARIEADFSPEFQKLRADFNTTVGLLSDTVGSVVQSARAIAESSAQVTHASADMARRTEAQAANLEEAAAALEEITTTTKNTAENASHATKVVGAAKVDAELGGQVVETAISAMDQIAQSSKQITDIIGVIDEIAFQTNLLALNAGVEAARAGEAGRGFAVVASEVRALAQRSGEASKEIRKLISTSGEHVAAGVRHVGESGTALRRIVEQVIEIDALVVQMAAASQQQASGLREVNGAIAQLDQVTQQNAAMIEESTAAAESLTNEAVRLRGVTDFFAGGGSAAVIRPAA